ncbi:hypothetical protein SAMN05216229_103160 [Geopseudomonas sagittaria]|uniref:Uncharacterized protein n=1 Tax=Geopseudomonas sagittaria TaxID=1135990 RepID=A0A1I5R4S8_9GAMM|nr:hypothetical protein [Pseudomonas sagittaria]SFP53512.1 hypothetical protein SAMN05216229_103160 [Pseudomonas sagittaria]
MYNTSLMNTTASQLGFWSAGFIIPMVASSILLQFAGSPKRKPGTSITLRVLSILVAAFFVYAGYVGGGEQINPGGLLAFLVTVAWAIKQHLTHKTASQPIQADAAEQHGSIQELELQIRGRLLCAKCGTDNSTEAGYCYKCGTQLSQVESPSAGLLHLRETVKGATESTSNTRRPSARKTNFLVTHWRGDYSLGFSYWVIGSLLTIVVVAISAATGSINGLRELGPRTSGAVILAFYGFIIPLSLWQLVGIWRSANKHSQRGGKAIWASLAKVMVILGLLRAAVDFTTMGVPLISEGAKLLAGLDSTPPHAIRLLRDGTELELAGGMPFGTTDAIKKFLDAAPAIQVIHLNSQGGRMNEAYQLYKTIKEKGLITYTSADCVSACSFAFLAGRERYLGESGRLGFHSMSLGELSGEALKEINDEFRRTLKDHGAPNSFIDHALSTSPKDMWYPSKDELLRAKIIDSVVDSRHFGLSGVTQWRDAQKIESGLLTNPAFSALAQYDQPNYARLRNIFVAGIQKGRAEIEIQNEIRSIFLGELIPTYLKKAPNEALIRYWRSQIAQMIHLAKLNPQYCTDFAYPELAKSTLDFQHLLPKDMLIENFDALAAVIKGARTNPQESGSTPQIQSDLEAAVMRVVQEYPWTLEVLANPANHKDDPASLCAAIIALYSEVLAIPSGSRSGPALRNMLSE